MARYGLQCTSALLTLKTTSTAYRTEPADRIGKTLSDTNALAGMSGLTVRLFWPYE